MNRFKRRVKTSAGRAKDLGSTYFRSKWERNYARYLNRCIELGEIKCWEYETDTFWFESIKRGVRSYTPDFKVTRNDGSVFYIEVKGHLDRKSKTKLKRLRKYHPTIELRLVDVSEYTLIREVYGSFLTHWED